jgi:uncharacterized protein
MIPSAPVMRHQPVIDGLEFARTGSKLQGEWPVSAFPRLRDSLHSDLGVLRYVLEGVPEEQGWPALRLQVEGVLQLTCQRCLGAMDFPLHLAVSLQLLATQEEMDAEPLQAEGPERIVAGREMQVRVLVEDEVLLALPLAPRHERCAGKPEQADAAKPSPFAGLRRLVGDTKH